MLGFLKRAAVAFSFRRGDMPEPPPKGWSLGLNPTYQVTRFPSQEALDAEVAKRGLGASRAYSVRQARAATDPKTREVLMLEPHLYHDGEEPEVVKHEGVHTYGLVHHPNGRDWLTPDGRIWADLTPQDQQAYLAHATADPEVQHDWSQAFNRVGGGAQGGR